MSRRSRPGGTRTRISVARSRPSPTWGAAAGSGSRVSATPNPRSSTSSRACAPSGSSPDDVAMRALRFHAALDLRIEDVPEPSMPEPGDVLVRTTACGICGTDLHEYVAGPIVTPVEPHPLTGAQNPQILGHEFAGDVVATGPGVTTVAEGRPVG